MVSRKPIPFTLTAKGRHITFSLITCGTLAVTAAKFGMHTFLLNYYTDFVQYYKNGAPVPVPVSLQERCKKCMDLIKISDAHKKLIRPFSVYGFDLFHAGTTTSKFGVVIGIPVNFAYQSVEDMEKDKLQVNQKKVDFTTEVGKKLADSIILPEKVQEFALCREILMSDNYKVILESTYPFTCIFSAYSFTQYANHKLNLYAAPKIMRLCLYSIVGAFCFGCYYLLQDATEVYYETKVDKQLCSLGPDYIESGIIFYDKLLKRNQALRELMGKEGEEKYSKLGNENFGIRQPRTAIVHRKKFFEIQLQEAKGTQQAENNEPKGMLNIM